MKRYFGISVLLVLCFTNLYAFDFTTESTNGQNLYYSINTDGLSVTLTYPNTSDFPWEGYNPPTGHIVIPTQVSHEGITYAVTAIGSNALANCGIISSITIPHSITSIADDAFANTTIDTLVFSASACSNRLKKDIFGQVAHLHVCGSVTQIPAEAFKDDTLLQRVLLDSIGSIGVRSFKNCSSLQSISLPATISSIGAEAFSNCNGLDEVQYLGALSDWCHIQFGDSLSNPISQSHSININGEGLQRLTIPDNINNISSYTFYGCSSIRYIMLPSHVSSIAAYAFTNINPDTLHFYASNSDARLAKRTFGNVKHLFIGGNVTAIGTSSFANDTTLTTITIESAQRIEAYAFRNCTNLDTLTLSATIDSILYAAFANCNNLYTINVQRATPPHIDSTAFTNTPTDKTIHIPCGSLNAYQNGWTGGGILSEPNTFTISTNPTDSTMGYTESTQPTCLNPNATIEAHPYNGYRFLCWNDNDTTNPRNIAVTQDTTFTAHFAPNNHTVSASPFDSTQGYVNGGGIYPYLGTATLVAVPTAHHHFLHWQDSDTNNPRQLTVTCDTIFTAFFSIDSLHVSAHSNNETYGTITGSGFFPYGDTISLIAQANPHHHFVCWQDNDTTNPRQIVVTQDLTIEGIFHPDSHSVTLQSNNPHYGTVEGAGTYTYGTTAILSATPSAHYHFLHWNDGETINPRQVSIISDTLFVAIFAIDSHTVTLIVDDAQHGTVEGTGDYAYGTQVRISATAFDGYTFTGWSDGVTDNPYQLSLTSDTLLTATFATLESIAEANGTGIKLCVRGNSIYLSGTTGEPLQLFDISGRLLLSAPAENGKAYTVPQKGIYCIKIGNNLPQKVIVP